GGNDGNGFLARNGEGDGVQERAVPVSSDEGHLVGIPERGCQVQIAVSIQVRGGESLGLNWQSYPLPKAEAAISAPDQNLGVKSTYHQVRFGVFIEVLNNESAAGDVEDLPGSLDRSVSLPFQRHDSVRAHDEKIHSTIAVEVQSLPEGPVRKLSGCRFVEGPGSRALQE